MNTGFFTMEDVYALVDMKTLDEAKAYALGKIKEMPEAKPENISKATAAVNKATSLVKLIQTVTNFVLAHPSEGLKVIR